MCLCATACGVAVGNLLDGGSFESVTRREGGQHVECHRKAEYLRRDLFPCPWEEDGQETYAYHSTDCEVAWTGEALCGHCWIELLGTED
jgi:hypothetical protein